MIKSRYTNLLCGVIVAVMLIVTGMFAFGESLGMVAQSAEMPYVQKLFSNDRVHTLDIVVEASDWQTLLDSPSSKTYVPFTAVIDGEKIANAAIRTKGNSSLSTVASSDSDRYSFKIEFDHYVDGRTYYGLDKLALNNITQDSTYLKDFLAYQMMDAFGAYAPLCSFIWITVNGEDWGLYLAVEGIEEAFVERTYGALGGQLYKPDSMDMMGGGNRDGGEMGEMFEGFQMLEGMPENFELPEGFSENMEEPFPGFGEMERDTTFDPANMPAGFEPGNMESQGDSTENDPAQTGGGQDAAVAGMRVQGGGMGGFGRSNDVALIYTDDSPESYANIFDNAKFDPTGADKARLIDALKQLNAGENLEEVVDIEEVLRYFVVHNFVLNFDSYTGSMTHNYYLYEDSGQLSMIAWDYNLSFGAFAMGGMGMDRSGSSTGATSLVNYPIDSPVSGTTLEDRPMLGQLLSNETYLAQYHNLFDAFISEYFESGEFETVFDSIVALISPYVEKDPTKFCTYEEFQTGVETLRSFCLLRAESIRGQLDGIIPSTSEGQAADNSNFVDASFLNTQDMGSQNDGFGGGNRGGNMQRGARNTDTEMVAAETSTQQQDLSAAVDTPAQEMVTTFPGDGEPPQGMPSGMEFPSDTQSLQAPSSGTPAGNMTLQPQAESTADVADNADATDTASPQAAQQRNVRNPGDWGMPGAQQSQATENSLPTGTLLAISGGILLLGLLFAWLYKR